MKSVRKIHRLLSYFLLLPTLVIFITGVLLLLRHHSAVIQPKKETTKHQSIDIGLAEIYQSLLKSQASIKPDAVAKIVIRPQLGLVEVFSQDNIRYVQIDGQSGEVLADKPRYTSLLITLHEGVFWGSWVRDFLFLPASVLLVLLLGTGAALLLLRSQMIVARLGIKRFLKRL